MAVKKGKHTRGEPGARKKHQRAWIASRLAPVEELELSTRRPVDRAAPESHVLDTTTPDFVDGSLIFDGEQIDIPHQILNAESGLRGPWLSPVLLVVLTIALSFTVFIAYLIHAEPV